MGAFKDCNARPHEFSKITLIYGRNTYGKSTLGDIFSSLKSKDPKNIIARKTIPDDSTLQNIDISFATDGENEGDGKSIFRNGEWQQGLRDSHNLAVYDDAFYYSHVFTARSLTRDNKTNFSDFILGKQGVEKARLIEEKTKEKGDKTRRITALKKDAFSDVANLEIFLQLEVVDDFEVTKQDLVQAREEYANINKQKKEAASIKARSNLSKLSVDKTFIDSAAAINKVLDSKLENPHEAAKKELQNHINSCFSKPEGAEQWIQQGLGYISKDRCSFCGQTIPPEVNELLDIYRQCFDDQFERHEGYVKSNINRHKPQLNLKFIEALYAKIENSLLIIQTYPELSAVADTQKTMDDLSELYSNLRDLLDLMYEQASAVIGSFNSNIHRKFERAQNQVELVGFSELSSLFEILESMINAINDYVTVFNDHAESLKKSVEEDQIEKSLNELKEKGSKLSQLVQRYEKQESCKEYQDLTAQMAVINEKIPQLRQELEDEQAEFLNQYFANVNSYFKALGSREFELEHGVSHQGNRPVNFFKVKFRSKRISESDLDKVFSESDRRSLGLAIFLSSLDAMDEQELKKTVVVFDDPVTSFDNHRVGQTHTKLVQLADRCEQIIILSHFKDGIANFINVHGFNRSDIKLIEIVKDDHTSKLQTANTDIFVRCAHQQNTHELIDFTQRITDKLSCKPRVYLENVLQLRFSKQIREHSITNANLDSRIQALEEVGVISNAVADKLQCWRKDLNPEHHIWLDDDVENQRNTTAEFVNFVFHELTPASQMEI